MDPRFEIRDAQIFLGRLVDEGLIKPDKIAATGGSYGGSESMHFAVLKNRMMMPDGSLVPWTSPLGTPMSTAVATPNIPWTDLIQSLAPNGDTLDYLEDGSFTGVGGVMKESYVNGLYISARAALPGTDPSADLAGLEGPAGCRRALHRRRQRGDVRRNHQLPLLLLRRRQPGAGAAADVERLHRRPFPG